MKHKAKTPTRDLTEFKREWADLKTIDKLLMSRIIRAMTDGEKPKAIKAIILAAPHLSRAKKTELIKVYERRA